MDAREPNLSYSQDSPSDLYGDTSAAEGDDKAAQQQLWDETENAQHETQQPISPPLTTLMTSVTPDRQLDDGSSQGPTKATLVLPHVPDLAQQALSTIPQISELYEANKLAYADPSNTMALCLERGVALGLALLAHYYPADQGFEICATTFDLMLKYGWTIEFKSPEEYGEYITISVENIAGFVVYKMHSVSNEDGTTSENLVPHTYLCVMADRLESFPRWQLKPEVLRGDVMTHSLLTEAKIEKGHCIVIIGTRMEFYKFDSIGKADPLVPWPVPREYNKFKNNWSLDMTEWGPDVASIWWTWLATSPVVYQNGVVSQGSSAVAVTAGVEGEGEEKI